MSGLRDAFDQIVADVPVYGDLDQAIEQADRERRHRYAVVIGLAAAAVVLVVIAGIVGVSGGTNTAPPISPGPTPITPGPTLAKTQSPETWADSPVAATRDRSDWHVPDPLEAARDAWFSVVAEHLDPTGKHLELIQGVNGATDFVWPADLPNYSVYGRVELLAAPADGTRLVNRCPYLRSQHSGNGNASCSGESIAGPDGERAKIFRFERLCGAYEGGGPAPATCGDYAVAVAVERRDGSVSSVMVEGRGTLDYNPFSPKAMAAAAADPRLTLPEAAFAVPSDQAVASVLAEHFPSIRPDKPSTLPDYPGYVWTWGKLGRTGLNVSVWPAGGAPACGRSWLVECVERRVFGADDPTTVYVGTWDEEDWADCCPKNSRGGRRVFVYVGPRHTVVVGEFRILRAHEEPLGADLDQELIDLALDPQLQ